MKIKLSFKNYLNLKEKAMLICVSGGQLNFDNDHTSSQTYKYSMLKITRFVLKDDVIVTIKRI